MEPGLDLELELEQLMQVAILDKQDPPTIMSFEKIKSKDWSKVRSVAFRQFPVSACRVFLGLSFNSLKSLNLKRVGLQDIFHLKTFPLSQLQELDISFNNLRNLQGFRSLSLPALQFLSLPNNQIFDIRSLVLSDMPLLKHLNLDNNDIKYLQDLRFASFPSLVGFFISNNKVSDINCFILADLPSLELIVMKDNEIRDIQPLLFSCLGKLRVVSFENNPLRCIPKLTNGFGQAVVVEFNQA